MLDDEVSRVVLRAVSRPLRLIPVAASDCGHQAKNDCIVWLDDPGKALQ